MLRKNFLVPYCLKKWPSFWLKRKQVRATVKNDNEIYITADTVVNSNDQILNKPANAKKKPLICSYFITTLTMCILGCIKTAQQTMHFCQKVPKSHSIYLPPTKYNLAFKPFIRSTKLRIWYSRLDWKDRN